MVSKRAQLVIWSFKEVRYLKDGRVYIDIIPLIFFNSAAKKLGAISLGCLNKTSSLFGTETLRCPQKNYNNKNRKK